MPEKHLLSRDVRVWKPSCYEAFEHLARSVALCFWLLRSWLTGFHQTFITKCKPKVFALVFRQCGKCENALTIANLFPAMDDESSGAIVISLLVKFDGGIPEFRHQNYLPESSQQWGLDLYWHPG